MLQVHSQQHPAGWTVSEAHLCQPRPWQLAAKANNSRPILTTGSRIVSFLCVFLVFLLGRFAVFHAPFRCRNGLFEGTHRNPMICLVLVVVLDAISILVFWLHFHRPVNPRRCLVVLVKMAATCRSSRPPPVRMRALAATRYKHENTRPAKAIDIH